MKKGLTRVANYARDRGIIYLLEGTHGDMVYFAVREIESSRVRKFFERLLQEDNEGINVDIRYVKVGRSLLG